MSMFNKNNEDDFVTDPAETEEELYTSFPEDEETQEEDTAAARSFSDFRSSEYFMLVVSLILALIFLLTSGLLVYRTHALSTENSRLESRLQRDNKLKKSEAEYENETENLQIETDTLINRYGAGNTPEKTIMFLANLSSTTGISVTSIEFGESGSTNLNESASQSEDTEEMADQKSSKDGSGPYYLNEYQVTMSYTGTYGELKKAIEFIEDYGERTTVNDLTSTYDETTNKLTGSMTLNMYTLSGTEHEYTAPSVTGSVGNSNIFG